MFQDFKTGRLSDNRSATGMSSFSFDFPHCHWLDCEENHWKPTDRNPVDLVEPAQEPRLHRWPRTGLLSLFKYQMICATIVIEVQNWTLKWPRWTKVKLGLLGCINDCLSTTHGLIKLTSVCQIHILYNFHVLISKCDLSLKVTSLQKHHQNKSRNESIRQ